jgi:hypothetical protein
LYNKSTANPQQIEQVEFELKAVELPRWDRSCTDKLMLELLYSRCNETVFKIEELPLSGKELDVLSTQRSSLETNTERERVTNKAIRTTKMHYLAVLL